MDFVHIREGVIAKNRPPTSPRMNVVEVDVAPTIALAAGGYSSHPAGQVLDGARGLTSPQGAFAGDSTPKNQCPASD
jgi:hypothetical protein